jgi:RNA polymerase sigma-70 factor, ECF subfamily
MFQFALSVLGPSLAPEAEDAVQLAALKAFQAIHLFRQEASFSTWFCRIVRNEALAIKERARNRLPHGGEGALLELRAEGPSPEDRAAAGQRDKDLLECIAALPNLYQIIVRLYYWLDWPVGEIAEVLGQPENTVKSYLQRTRKLLHTAMIERGYESA